MGNLINSVSSKRSPLKHGGVFDGHPFHHITKEQVIGGAITAGSLIARNNPYVRLVTTADKLTGGHGKKYLTQRFSKTSKSSQSTKDIKTIKVRPKDRKRYKELEKKKKKHLEDKKKNKILKDKNKKKDFTPSVILNPNKTEKALQYIKDNPIKSSFVIAGTGSLIITSITDAVTNDQLSESQRRVAKTLSERRENLASSDNPDDFWITLYEYGTMKYGEEEWNNRIKRRNLLRKEWLQNNGYTPDKYGNFSKEEHDKAQLMLLGDITYEDMEKGNFNPESEHFSEEFRNIRAWINMEAIHHNADADTLGYNPAPPTTYQ